MHHSCHHRAFSLCVLCPDCFVIRTAVHGFRALPNPVRPHLHLITSATALFPNRVTSPGYISLWGSQANPPPSCPLGSIWPPVSGNRPVPEPCLHSYGGLCSPFPCLGCQTLACGVCAGPMMLRGSPGSSPFRASWAPPGPHAAALLCHVGGGQPA